MPIFEYKALTSSGKTKKGIVDADTARDARSKLRSDHMHVTEMWEVADKKSKKDKSVSKKTRSLPAKKGKPGGLLSKEIELFQPKISTRDLATFTRQFSTLLRSGIQLADALNALVEQCADPHLERVLRNVKEEITSGNNLAEAMAKHPRFFSDLYVNMVRAGEASGRLDVVLTRIADYLQKQASLKGKVLAAITYPAIMVIVGMAVVIFLMSYVVPRITQILKDRGQPLPFITEILMTASDFTKAYWIYVLLAMFIGGFFLKSLIGTDAGRLKFDALLLRLPIFGTLFSKQAISRFALTFSTLLKSGLPALDSLKIVALVVNNAKLTQVINNIHARIIEGADIATPIRKSKVFPPMVGYMVSVGEQSGQLEEILDRIAESYEEELDLTIQRLTSMIEPIIIILLAVVVGFIIAAVLLPLLDFSSM
ncbi:MAG: type II secretion system inner membrane protein GspF [Planctomycetota bacterium]|nr:type II secretion system inner membrane protein GspF [Planctomycetota bacterium]MEE3297439.1 type II secretion system inner membrane protein GspF [Planctomycetota bacterium]|tara:strand:+ start:1313 stop:2590 length:1278 start_codon:yes stop_codon:yes gene_type:complete